MMNSETVKRDWWRLACYGPAIAAFSVGAVVKYQRGMMWEFQAFLAVLYMVLLLVMCKSLRYLLAVLWRSLRGEC